MISIFITINLDNKEKIFTFLAIENHKNLRFYFLPKYHLRKTDRKKYFSLAIKRSIV